MKSMIVALLLCLLCAMNARAASPYVQGLWTKGNPIYVSEGTTMMPSSLAYDRTFTNLALFYHPLSAGSLWDIPWLASREPAWAVPYLPRESWACTGGISYAPSSASISQTGVSGAQGGIGCGFNLAETARQEIYNALSTSSNETVAAIAALVKPTTSGATIFVSRQWDSSINQPGKLAPRWFFAAGYGF